MPVSPDPAHPLYALVRRLASMGYSTAFWRSIRLAQPLYERGAWHTELQQRARQPYPEPLRRNIVRLNRPYLRDHVFSFRQQVAKAVARNDLISVNHRLAAWLASYVDILFALNHVPHPGEKRDLDFLLRECPLLPHELPGRIEGRLWLAGQPTPTPVEMLDQLVGVLDELLQQEGLLPTEAVGSESSTLSPRADQTNV